MDLWLWITVATAGAAGQFLDTLAGMGFGALSSTAMVTAGISPVVVIGTVNLAKVGSGLASGLSHWRFGNVQWSWVVPLGVPAVAGGVLAALVLTYLPTQVIRGLVPMALLLMGLLILRRFLSKSAVLPLVAGGSQDAVPITPQAPLRVFTRSYWARPSAVWLGSIGFVGGVLNGFSGAFGPFTTSAVVLRQRRHPRFAIGTVNFVEFFVAGAISIVLLSRVAWGSFHWELPVALIVGSVITAPLGAYLSRHLPVRPAGVVVGLALITLNSWSIVRFLLS
jgi:hypothetical protein